VFASLLVKHWLLLGRPLKPILIQQFASLQFGLELVQRSAEGREFKALHILNERPQSRGMHRYASSDLVGHVLVVVTTFIQE
jgi:hypothetical protein